MDEQLIVVSLIFIASVIFLVRKITGSGRKDNAHCHDCGNAHTTVKNKRSP
jgi:hypothetical protein